MGVADHLRWPFFELRHRSFAERLEAWASANLGEVGHHEVDAAWRPLRTERSRLMCAPWRWRGKRLRGTPGWPIFPSPCRVLGRAPSRFSATTTSGKRG